ncbi:PAS domain-containing sensor histidine kinase [Falsiroseomonas tokyonensis]|uniref:histidine kinase n=1 Tax=Falsiroseomonas tokyonensis TaxID=430521 RepID=A0ABV7BSR6_9PROT|nr:PAS domain-containing sensor histidine kinase [Falsiroseomonas tokyonensis]MBU8537683.1 response regulator [Falsiroseomonas tokyonensis]
MTESRNRLQALLRRALRPNPDPMLRAVLEAAGVGMALLDAEDRLTAWNSDFAGLCGPMLPPRDGLPLTQLLAREGREEVLAALSGGQKQLVTLAGEGGPKLEAERRPLPGPDRLSVLRLARPASRPPEQAAAAARLQAVGALAGGIAHDFNNLLTAIAGSAEAALTRAPDGPAAPELRQVMESAGRGAALVRQLLAFARQQALRPRVVDLNEAVASMGELLKRLLGSRVKLALTLEEPARRVRIDPTQLDQVIMNLALNARDAMPEGGAMRIGTGHAVVLRPEQLGNETLPAGRYALLEVSDSGVGIPADALPRIFDPFFTTRRDQGGTGLGLSTVHGIVRQSGGFISVDSKQGEGSRFRIWLPRHDGPADPPVPTAMVAAPGPALPAPAVPAVHYGSMPVLLVEDEVPLLRLAERALRRAGFEVMSAGCAEEALEMLDRGAPAPLAMVSDVVMPGMDGLELAGRLRAIWPDLPVLLVSGYAEAALGRDLAAERIRLLAKPYSLGSLVAELRAILPAGAVKVS